MSCVIYFLIDTGCNNASFYGSKCEYPCPINCKFNKCHIQNGTCFSCRPGWSGIYCNTSKITYSTPAHAILEANFVSL